MNAAAYERMCGAHYLAARAKQSDAFAKMAMRRGDSRGGRCHGLQAILFGTAALAMQQGQVGASRAFEEAAMGEPGTLHELGWNYRTVLVAAKMLPASAALNGMDGLGDLDGIGGFLKKAAKVVTAPVRAAVGVIKEVGYVVDKAVLRPIENVLPKPLVNIVKTVADVAWTPTKLAIDIATNPLDAKTWTQIPGELLTKPLTAGVKIASNTATLIGVKEHTIVGKLDEKADKLQTWSVDHPLETIGAAAVAVGSVLAAPVVLPAIGSAAAAAGSAIAGAAGAVAGAVGGAGAAAFLPDALNIVGGLVGGKPPPGMPMPVGPGSVDASEFYTDPATGKRYRKVNGTWMEIDANGNVIPMTPAGATNMLPWVIGGVAVLGIAAVILTRD